MDCLFPRFHITDASMGEGDATEARGGLTGTSGRGGSYGSGAGVRRLARVQSPPCYRNIFADGDSEEAYAPWKARRPQQQAMSRYRWGAGQVKDAVSVACNVHTCTRQLQSRAIRLGAPSAQHAGTGQ